MADGANITLATAQGAAPTPRRDVGRDECLAGEPLGPSGTNPCFQRLATRLEKLTPDKSTAQRASLCWFFPPLLLFTSQN